MDLALSRWLSCTEPVIDTSHLETDSNFRDTNIDVGFAHGIFFAHPTREI